MSEQEQTPDAKVEAYFRTLSLRHSQFDECMVAAEKLFETAGISREARGMLILGESRMGKTHIVSQLMQRHPEIHHSDHWEKPVVGVALSTAATRLAGLYPRLLDELHALPREKSGNTDRQQDHALTRLKNAATRLIVVDEFQHALGRDRTNFKVADGLKDFMNRSGIPMVFCGMPESQSLLAIDEQIRNRISVVVHLRPFDAKAPESLRDLEEFLVRFDLAIKGFLGENSFLANPEFLWRVFVASRGKPGLIRELIMSATKVAYRRNGSCLSLDDFRNGIEESGQFLKRSDANPFRLDLNHVMQMPRLPHAERPAIEGERLETIIRRRK